MEEQIKFTELPIEVQLSLMFNHNKRLIDKLKALELENKSLQDELDRLLLKDKLIQIDDLLTKNKILQEQNKELERKNFEQKQSLGKFNKWMETSTIYHTVKQEEKSQKRTLNQEEFIDALKRRIRNQQETLSIFQERLNEDTNRKLIKSWKDKLTLRNRIENEFFKDKPELHEQFIQLCKDNPYIELDE
jgi:hypothetical protein